MILKRLFKSLRSEDKAVPPVDGTNPPGQSQSAITAPDPGTRRQACKGTADLALLGRVALDDGDAGVREYASARLRNLICGTEPDSPALSERLARLESLRDPQLAAHLALQGKEPDLRRAALAFVADPAVLSDCALHDTIAQVRATAAERLQDRKALERVARHIGKKDKNVYRLVRQRLKAIAEREEAPARLRAEAETLCEQMERLGRRGTWSQDRALLDHLERQWADLAGEPPAEAADRYRRARDEFHAGYDAYFRENQARIEAEQARERARSVRHDLIRSMAALGSEQDADLIEGRIGALEAQWEELGPGLDGDASRLRRQLDKAGQQARSRLAELRALTDRDRRLAALLDRSAAWLSGPAPLQRKELRRWSEQGDGLAALRPDDVLAQRYAEAREQLQAHIDKETAGAERKLAALPHRLDLLEQELDAGELKKAGSLHQSIQADLALATSAGLRPAALEQRLHAITPRLRELQNWRKWGTDLHRQELCAQMEGLITAELPLSGLAEQVQTLQAEWKRLDHGGSPVNEGLWRRFHGAADKAFERCRPWIEEQARERDAHREAREALCLGLEEFLDQVDWERMDWKKAVRADREVRQAWAGAGPVDPRHRRGLERRFRAAMKRLEGRLAEERARNRAFREGLIAQALALMEEPDLDRATQAIKDLQREWHTTVSSKRALENRLWQQFREASDRVFDRRREQFQAQQHVLTENLALIESLCAELEETGRAPGDDPEALAQQMHRLQGRWDSLRDLDLPRPDTARVRRRWQRALEVCEGQIRKLGRNLERRDLDRLRERAALCGEIERAAGSPADTDDWRTRWRALPDLEDAEAAATIERRVQAALAGSPGTEANGRARRRICLEMELLAGVESPAEATRDRLAFQVNRLSERLGHGAEDPLDEAPRVERDWYLCGPAPAPHAEALEARFERARGALLGQESPTEQAPA